MTGFGAVGVAGARSCGHGLIVLERVEIGLLLGVLLAGQGAASAGRKLLLIVLLIHSFIYFQFDSASHKGFWGFGVLGF